MKYTQIRYTVTINFFIIFSHFYFQFCSQTILIYFFRWNGEQIYLNNKEGKLLQKNK